MNDYALSCTTWWPWKGLKKAPPWIKVKISIKEREP